MGQTLHVLSAYYGSPKSWS